MRARLASMAQLPRPLLELIASFVVDVRTRFDQVRKARSRWNLNPRAVFAGASCHEPRWRGWC